jgi:hypothetical protein
MRRFAYHILKKYHDKTLVWVQAVRDLDTANSRVKELEGAFGGDYVVFDQHTQQVVASTRPSSRDQTRKGHPRHSQPWGD